jgi:sugar lactone lactonase YvrE
MIFERASRILTLTIAASLVPFVPLVGCGTGAPPSATQKLPAVAVRSALHGKVHGGQQPISGATIQLYTIGTAGNASASTPLLSPAATTDANGSFSITGQYACPQQGSLTYIVATGGNPGLSAGTNNAALGLMAVLGPCNYATTNNSGAPIYTLDPSLNVNMNEVTTVAAVYALAPFMADYADIGTAGSLQGITYAFNSAAALADIGGGVSPGPTTPATVDAGLTTGFPVVVNTLADIIATCVNSNGTGSPCSLLFRYLTVNGVTPSNTIAIALAIAKNPATSPTNLINLITPSAPFVPVLPAAPNDWTISFHYTRINFNGPNLSSPGGLAFDGNGNLWIANETSNAVTELYSGADGVHNLASTAQFTGGGILGAQALAVDQSNNIWIANTAGNSVVELDDNGNVLSGSGYTAGGINAPVAIAVDSGGNAWVANFNGNSITQVLANGSASGFSPITMGTYAVSMPTGIAVDSNNQVWVSNSGLSETSGLTAQVLRFDANGNPQPSIYQMLQGTLGMAIDPYDTVWIAGNGTSSVGAFTHKGASAITGGVTTGGGLTQPVGIAVDGNGTIWVTNSATAGSLTELAATTGIAVSPITGFGSLNAPLGVAVDASGDVWTANAGDNTLTEFIGLAAPTITPIVANVASAIALAKRSAQSK